MSDEPVVLNDDDFDEDVPPGYRSHKAKERYIPLMTILLGGTFVLQFIVPFVIMMVGLPMMAMQQVHQTTGQYVKMTDWLGALWYPASEVQPGGPWGVVTPDRGLQSKLMAMDYRGKPIEHTPYELETTPEWFVADGDRLLGVSKNEVVELNRDGSRPIVMRPTRYLIYASQPLLFEGKLAIVDYDEENQWSLYRFERGEWVRAVGLAIPDFSPKRQTAAAVDAPADALNASGAAAGEQSSDGRSPSPQNTKTPGSISTNHPSVDVNEVRIVMIGETPNVMFEQNHRLYHHVGLPVQKASDGTGWTSIALSSHQDSMQETAWALTSVAGGPAAVVHFPDYSKPRMQLWRFQEGQWAPSSSSWSRAS